MIECPNCGSIAKMRLFQIEHFSFSSSTEWWFCDNCHCSVERVMKESVRYITFPNGEKRTERKSPKPLDKFNKV